MQVINLITQSKDESKKKNKYAPYSGFKTQSFVTNIPQTSERTYILSLSKKNWGWGEAVVGRRMVLRCMNPQWSDHRVKKKRESTKYPSSVSVFWKCVWTLPFML